MTQLELLQQLDSICDPSMLPDTDDENNTDEHTYDAFDETYDTISSQSSISSTIQESQRKPNLIFQPPIKTQTIQYIPKKVLPTSPINYYTQSLTNSTRQLRQLNDAYNNATNMLDCIEDMINDENEYLLAELKQIIDEIEVSVPNNTFIIQNNFHFNIQN